MADMAATLHQDVVTGSTSYSRRNLAAPPRLFSLALSLLSFVLPIDAARQAQLSAFDERSETSRRIDD